MAELDVLLQLINEQPAATRDELVRRLRPKRIVAPKKYRNVRCTMCGELESKLFSTSIHVMKWESETAPYRYVRTATICQHCTGTTIGDVIRAAETSPHGRKSTLHST